MSRGNFLIVYQTHDTVCLVLHVYTGNKSAFSAVCFRCVGEMLTRNKLRAYSVRAASAAEKSGLQRLSFASQRAVTALEMTIPEP